MNKKLIFLLVLTTIVPLNFLQSQSESENVDLEKFVYWFHVKADIKPHKETSKPMYVVRLSDEKPRHGTPEDYEYDLWKQVRVGSFLLIGPFLDFYDAKKAMEMYRFQNQMGDGDEIKMQNLKDIQFKEEYFWYFLSFKMADRNGSYLLNRIPAAVTSGQIKDFMLVLAEGLKWQKLAIGPFPSQLEAEESKRLNRLEEQK